MNATKLYVELSRKVMMMLTSQTLIGDFILHDSTLFKLRSLLLCRACKEICFQPFGSEYCQHLTCEDCLNEKTLRQTCKWCRNPDELSLDVHSKILIASYRKLCAILRGLVTGHTTKSPGSTKDVKAKLLQTIDEGCGLPRIVNKQNNELKQEILPDTESLDTGKCSVAIQADGDVIDEKAPVCPCCCKCPKENGDLVSKERCRNSIVKNEDNTDIVGDIKEEKKVQCDFRSDVVSSTVPDSIVPATFSDNNIVIPANFSDNNIIPASISAPDQNKPFRDVGLKSSGENVDLVEKIIEESRK